MYCKHCGTKNSEDAQYCINDGMPLKPASTGSQVVNVNSKFCTYCSHKNEPGSLYCSNCGQSLEKIESTKRTSSEAPQFGNIKKTVPVPTQISGISGIFQPATLIQAAKYAGITFAILLVLSFIASLVINNQVRDLFLADMSSYEADMFGGIIDQIKIVSMTDILMLSHMASLTYTADVMFFNVGITTKGGLFIFLIVPAIALIVTGFIYNKRHPELGLMDRFFAALSISVVYAVIIGIIGLFAGISVSVPDPSGFLGDITVSADYSFFDVLFKAFIISLLFTSIGTMIQLPQHAKEVGGNATFGISVQRAFVNTIIGIVIMAVISTGIMTSNELIQEEDIPASFKTAVVSQFGGYFWNLGQFSSLNFETRAMHETIDASYSILGGAKASDPEITMELRSIVKELFGGSLWYLFIVPVVLHLWAGNYLRKTTNGNILVEVGVYAIVFGVINALLTSMTAFSMSTRGFDAFNLSLGFSMLSAFFIGAILAFAAAYVGVMITNSKTATSEYDNQAS
ncbi:zinc ribbon domain-containing protein [Bacillus alkalicellulosilyticus]|uniref:zinc ribbon domain-containing protein n=1 Tax=Alkalihalobacterium alkalicellulosilyticum TaxID=1912214 RepID=UPI000995E750|nr:zinc ribbon domain-containing protein [Bacillus alkalicellulosilyticus]